MCVCVVDWTCIGGDNVYRRFFGLSFLGPVAEAVGGGQ